MNGMGGSTSSRHLSRDEVPVRPIGQRAVMGGVSVVEQLLRRDEGPCDNLVPLAPAHVPLRVTSPFHLTAPPLGN
jgi:hypothetical protein